MTDFRSALSEVRPFFGTGVAESIRHRTIRTVNDTGTSGMEDTWHGLLILQERKPKPIGNQIARKGAEGGGRSAYWVNRLWENTLGLVSGGIAEDL